MADHDDELELLRQLADLAASREQFAAEIRDAMPELERDAPEVARLFSAALASPETLARLHALNARLAGHDLHPRADQQIADRLTELLVQRGLDKLAAGQRSADAVHGSAPDREARYRKWQDAVNAEHRRDPTLSWTKISERVGKQVGRSGRTIRTHCTDPTRR